jgi:branched-chain amino acid transport system substrate-binding protein
MKGFTHAIKVSCEDHEGNGLVLIQQWDGKKWNVSPDGSSRCATSCARRSRRLAVEEGKKLNYTQRDCSKEK